MSETHFVGKISLRAIIVHDGKILLDRDVRDPDIWEIPGGRLNVGESLEEGLKREIFEELGIRIRVGRLVYSEQFQQASDGLASLMLAYEASLEDPEARLVLDPNEVAETIWIEMKDFEARKLYENCFRALKVYAAQQ